VTTPTTEGLLTTPYVTVAEFRAAPTYLDSDDLIPGGVQSNQDFELYNVLLRASAWAENYCKQPLRAHTAYEQTRARIDPRGRVFLHPSNTPVRQVTGLAFGSDFQLLSVLTDLTQVWVEDQRGIVVSAIPLRGTWAGTLEFGNVPPPGGEVYVEYTYIAGYCSTTLNATTASGAAAIVVNDGTGLQPPATGLLGTLAGSTARIWDPAHEEAVVIGAPFTQTSGQVSVPLVNPTTQTHTATAGPGGQVGISELPSEVHQAVIALAIALLCRDDTVSDEEPYPGTPYGPTTRRGSSGGKAGGLVDTAWQLLDPYKRVR
jgi:hypothetical protein